jgi:ankyrin repeat protein
VRGQLSSIEAQPTHIQRGTCPPGCGIVILGQTKENTMACAGRLGLSLVSIFVANVSLIAAPAADPRLVEAAKRQDKTAVGALLKQKVDVNSAYGDGTTALHWAAYWDDAELAGMLIAAGANVDARNDVGATPLWAGVSNGGTAVVESLIKAKANPNLVLPSGESPLMTAARSGNTLAVRLLVGAGADLKAKESTRGQNALMWAVSQQHPDVVKVLVEAGADLHARSAERSQVVNRGGDGNNATISENPPDIFKIVQGGWTPLMFAARQGDVESARVLVAAGANVNDTSPFATSALVVAAHSGNTPVALLLLEHGADPNAAGAGYAALHAAILRGDTTLVKALLDHKADPNAPVVQATYARRTSADYQIPKPMVGATPLWLAAHFQELEMLRALVAHGADGRFVMPDGNTVLMAAVEGTVIRARTPGLQVDEGVDAGQRLLDSVTIAITGGADVNAADEAGNTALHLAAGRGADNIIPLLVEKGAAIDAKNKKGQTPLAMTEGAGPSAQNPNRRGRGAKPSTAELLRKLGATQ